MRMHACLPALAAICLAQGIGAAVAPTFTIALGNRTGCVEPTTKHFARADGGTIDVQTSAAGLTANLAGSVAANAYLGRPGVATEAFHLVQEFEITCSDPKISAVSLTLESTLVGFVRSKYKGGACVQVASATVTPAGYPSSPLSVSYAPMCVAGSDSRLCNQHNEPITVESLPIGKYILAADLILQCEASGICDAHAAADFTSSGALPAEFVRVRDPFQNADKKNFGFTLALTAAPAGGSVAARLPRDAKVLRAEGTSMQADRRIPKNTPTPAPAALGVRFSPATLR